MRRDKQADMEAKEAIAEIRKNLAAVKALNQDA
jgi:hypothetical protein